MSRLKGGGKVTDEAARARAEYDAAEREYNAALKALASLNQKGVSLTPVVEDLDNPARMAAARARINHHIRELDPAIKRAKAAEKRYKAAERAVQALEKRDSTPGSS